MPPGMPRLDPLPGLPRGTKPSVSLLESLPCKGLQDWAGLSAPLTHVDLLTLVLGRSRQWAELTAMALLLRNLTVQVPGRHTDKHPD